MATNPVSDPKSTEPLLDLNDASVVIDRLHRAAEANVNSPFLQGSTCVLPGEGSLLMTGDLHDNGLNLMRIAHLAQLDAGEDHHVALHEIIHGPQRVNGRDYSIRTLVRVADLKVRYPKQVHILQSNHELAQLGGEGISKDGVNVVDHFNAGVEFLYPDDCDDVFDAVEAYVRSLHLAIRCPKGLLCSHSLPAPADVESFDTAVLYRTLSRGDLGFNGDAYNMVWGRNQSDALMNHLAAAWHTRLFICGHQPAEDGYERWGNRMLILASDHEKGVAVKIDLAQKYEDINAIIQQIIPLAMVTP